MDQIKGINKDKIKEIVSSHGFDSDLILKDYYITAILYLLKDIKGIYFKGGTALQKIFLNYSRLSEDIDFTVTGDVKKIKKMITNIIEESKLFNRVTKDKDVEKFTRLIVCYTGFSNEEDKIFIDLNKRAKLLLKPEIHKIPHFYKEDIPEFSIKTLNFKELVAEKMAAAIGRNKPRDHFDLYKIIENKIPIDIKLVKKKCKTSSYDFNIVKIFHKANKLKNRWDKDMTPLIRDNVEFKDVMQTLAKYFKYKEEKKKLKK